MNLALVQELIKYRSSDDVCPICLAPLISNSLRRAPVEIHTMACCGARIHHRCISRWLKSKTEPTCPICREKQNVLCAYTCDLSFLARRENWEINVNSSDNELNEDNINLPKGWEFEATWNEGNQRILKFRGVGSNSFKLLNELIFFTQHFVRKHYIRVVDKKPKAEFMWGTNDVAEDDIEDEEDVIEGYGDEIVDDEEEENQDISTPVSDLDDDDPFSDLDDDDPFSDLDDDDPFSHSPHLYHREFNNLNDPEKMEEIWMDNGMFDIIGEIEAREGAIFPRD
jgi:hypothetical protein